MYKYDVIITGYGCELVSAELTEDEVHRIKKYLKDNNFELEDIIQEAKHLSKLNLGVDEWYELDDICHIYGGYPHSSFVKITGEGTKIVKSTSEFPTEIDDFYDLNEHLNIHTLTKDSGIVVKGKLITKEPFNIDLLTLLVTQVIRGDEKIYIVTGFLYGDEYLKLLTTECETIETKTFITKTCENPCII